MGNEIVYCAGCQSRLLSADFDAHKAVWLSEKPYCTACVMGLVSSLPPEEEQRVLEQLAVKKSADPETTTPRKGTARRTKTSTARIPVIKDRRAVDPESGPPATSLLIGVAVVIGVVILGVVASTLPSSPAVPVRTAEIPRRELPPVEIPRPESSAPRTTPEREAALSAARRDDAARKALEKARAYGRSNAADLPGRIALLEEAAWECRGTSLAADARREHETLQKQRADQVASELSPVSEQARAAAAASHYGEAIQLLQKERSRLIGADWMSAVDQRILQVRQSAEQVYATLRDRALQARRRGAEEEVKAATDQVAGWGLDDLAAGLKSSLAALPPPERPLPPDVRTYLAAWENALAQARARDYPAAIRDLEAAASFLRDPAVKAESAVDLESLRLLSAAYADVLQTLARWPKGQKLSVEVDAGGTPLRLDGTVTRQGPGWIELKTEAEAGNVDLDDLTASCLRDLLAKLPGRKPDADPRPGILFLLLEGDPVDVTGLPPGALTARMLAYGARISEERGRPDLAAKEGEARSRFEQAERLYEDAATRLESFDSFRLLLSSYGDCAFVRRKRSFIAQKLDAEKDAGKDYVLVPDQMRAAGAFRRTSAPKAAVCWTSSADVPPEKENYVEFTYSVKPGVEYRCWVLVGGCCSETFAFDIQGTETSAEPGTPQRLPVKNAILFLKKSHAAHGGRKEPTRFEWVAVPLPKYASGGSKTLRLLSGQQGFSVALAVVSATRTAPPSDAQIKEWERARPPSASSSVEGGLVGWWTFDEGSGVTAGDSSPSRIAGTLRNDPVWTSGKRRGALSFDGRDDFVELPKDARHYFQGPFSVAAWVNVAVLPKSEFGMYVVSDYATDASHSSFAIRVLPTGAAQFFWQSEKEIPPHATSTGHLVPGTWTHLAGVWDGSMRTIYINGVPDGTNGEPQSRPDNRGNVSIGRPGAFNGLYFNGRIDDVRIYNRALSTAEVRSLAGK